MNNLKTLNNEELSRYMALSIFLSEVTPDNYNEAYKALEKLSLEDTVFYVWEPFEADELVWVLEEVESHTEFFLNILNLRS